VTLDFENFPFSSGIARLNGNLLLIETDKNFPQRKARGVCAPWQACVGGRVEPRQALSRAEQKREFFFD
jgi:hypothetical protein